MKNDLEFNEEFKFKDKNSKKKSGVPSGNEFAEDFPIEPLKYYTRVNDSQSHLRHARAPAKKLQSALRHMQRIARLAAGITLQHDIIDNTTDSDQLMMQLLHFKFIKTDDITDLDTKNNIRSEFINLKNLHGDLRSWEEVKRIGEKLLRMIEIEKTTKSMDNFRTMTEWKSKKAYLERMEAIRQDYAYIESLKPLKDHLIEERTVVKHERKHNRDLSFELTYLYMRNWTKFSYYKEKIDTNVRHWKMLAENGKKVKESEELFMNTKADRIAEFQHNANVFKELTQNTDNTAGNLKTIQNVFRNRRSRVHDFIKHPGLIHGFDDVLTILEDLRDGSFDSLVKTEETFELLKPLRMLTPAFQKVDAAFGKFNDVKREKMSKFVEYFKHIRTPVLSGYLAAESLYKCGGTLTSFPAGIDFKNVTVLMEAAVEMDQIIDNLWNANKFIWAVERTKTCRKSFQAFVETNKTYQLETFIKDADEMELAFDGFEGLLRRMSNKAEKIEDGASKISEFLSKSALFLPFFECLKNFTQEMKPIIQMIEYVQVLKPENAIIMTEAAEVITGMMDAAYELDWLRNELTAMKGAFGSDPFRNEVHFPSFAFTFGRAVRGITAFVEILEKKDVVNTLISLPELVKVELRELKYSGKLIDKNTNDLQQLEKMSKQLEELYGALHVWANQNFTESSTVLKNYVELFATAIKIPSIDYDLESLSESVTLAIPYVKDVDAKREFLKVREAVDALAYYGVDFTRYHNAFKSTHILDRLDSMFARYRNPVIMTTLPPTTAPPTSTVLTTQLPQTSTIPPSSSTSTTFESATESWFSISLLGVGALGLAVIMCASIAGAFLLFHKNRPTSRRSDHSEKIGVIDCAVELINDLLVDLRRILNSMSDEILNEIQGRSRELNAHQRKEMRKRTNTTDRQLERFCGQVTRMINSPKSPAGAMEEHRDECRELIPVEEVTRFKLADYGDRFSNDFIHANIVSFSTGLKFIVSQGPMQKKESEKVTVSTVEKFYWMAKQSEAAYIVMLCSFAELDCQYVPQNEKDVLKFERLKVTCKRKSVEERGDLVVRHLKIEFKSEKAFEVKHVQFQRWKAQTPPTKPDTLVRLLKRVRTSAKPVVVHCTDGVDRAGSFAYIEHCNQILKSKEAGFEMKWMDDLNSLRAMRSESIKSPVNMAFCITSLIEYTYDGEPPEEANFVYNAYGLFLKRHHEELRE